MASSTSSAAALLLLSAAALLSLLATPISADDHVKAREFLPAGQSLTQGTYSFTMQTDCNLVLYDNKSVVWSTDTVGQGDNCGLIMQGNGNLVIYSGAKLVWESNTKGQNGNYYLLLQTDGNVVIYDEYNKAIWATGTKVGNAAVVVIPDSNGTAAASGAAQNKVKELYP